MGRHNRSRNNSFSPMLLGGAMFLTLLNGASATPDLLGDNDLIDCATGQCQACGGPHGNNIAQQPSLTVIGKQNGGTYTPGETLTLASQQTQYALGAVSGNNNQLYPNNNNGRTNNNGLVITAPTTGTLTLVAVGADSRTSQCVYETIQLTLEGEGGGPPGGGQPGLVSPSPPPANGNNPGGGSSSNLSDDEAGGISGGTVAGVLFVLLLVGGGYYYFKVYKPKKAAAAGGVTMTQKAPPTAPVPPPQPGAPGYSPAPPLPPGWVEMTDPTSGHVYFSNSATGESSWVRPGGGQV